MIKFLSSMTVMRLAKYDRDIRWMRVAVLSLIALNLALLGWAVYRHDWVNGFAAACWALNCRVWLSTLSAQQRTRDRSRVTDAAIQHLMEMDR